MLGSSEWEDIKDIRCALHRALYDLDKFPKVLEGFLDSGKWRDYVDPNGNHYVYAEEEFVRFVQAKPEAGLGVRFERILDMCRWDVEFHKRLERMKGDTG